MSIEMYLGLSDQQAQSVRTVLGNRINAYQSLQMSLNQFILNSPSLSGQTYDSAKNYSSQVLVPLIKGCILLDEAIKEACAKMPSEYRSQVDYSDLKEDELTDKIYTADMTISRYMYLIELEYRKDTPNWQYLSNLRSSENNYRNLKQQLEDKLQKLRMFNVSSVNLFSSIQPLIDAVHAGIRQASSSWCPSTQRFVKLDRENLAWTDGINSQWEKRNQESTYSELDDNSKALLKKAEDDKKSGKISDQTYNSIKSALLIGGVSFLYELAKSKLTDEVVERFTQKAVEWLTYNFQNMQFSAVGALVGGGHYTVPINVNPTYSSFVSGAAKYGAPVIGGIIDFGMQVKEGENPGHALVKTGAHVVIGIGGAKAGAAIGAAIGTGIPIPIVGTVSGAAIGAVAGFVIGVAGSLIFDWGYDEVVKPFINSASQKISEGIDAIGDMVGGFFSGLGAVFK